MVQLNVGQRSGYYMYMYNIVAKKMVLLAKIFVELDAIFVGDLEQNLHPDLSTPWMWGYQV